MIGLGPGAGVEVRADPTGPFRAAARAVDGIEAVGIEVHVRPP